VNVLIDYAHNDLWESLALLFEDRLGWELYRPIGMEWYEQGLWGFERQTLGDAVARQFLSPYSSDRPLDGYSERDDEMHTRTYRLVTMEQARALKPDIVIACLAENETGLSGFAKEVGAHYGIQIGNQGAENQWGLAEFVLSSVTLPQLGGGKPWVPHVFYHQEFSLSDFRFEYPPESQTVATRVQCFAGTPDYARFTRLSGLSGLDFRWFGHCGDPDQFWGGNAHTTAEIAEQMRATRTAFHVKRWSDGYGHVIHNWFAVGRPVVGSSSYYTGESDGIVKLAAPLFVEGETSFDLDKLNDDEAVRLFQRLATDDDFHQKISTQAAERFRQVVDFDQEAEAVKAMFDQVLSDRTVAA